MDFRLEIEKLFDNGSIGVVGVPHPNGADELQCPCCGAWERVEGHVGSGLHSVDSMTHKPDCDLERLYNVIRWPNG